jgi:hypothetical protein
MRGAHIVGLLSIGVGTLFVAACTVTASAGFGNGTGGSGGSGAANGTGGGHDNYGSGATGGGGIIVPDSGSGAGSGNVNCNSGPNDDADHDGFTPADGDCNDCDPNANPGAYDIAGNNVDEDCDGTADNAPVGCDAQTTDIAGNDPMDGARAIGLCQVATNADKKWGVLDAQWVMADGSPSTNPLGHGILNAFGPNVNCQEGHHMLALSSGTARQPTDPDYDDVGGHDSGTSSPPPPGFPIDSPACGGVNTQGSEANDPAGLELTIRVPTNAKSFTFNFNFFTYEWPVYVCSQYNDFFVALQDPAPSNAQMGNISFDSQGNPVSVNNGLVDVCGCDSGPPCNEGMYAQKKFDCPLGTNALIGTGFGVDTGYEDHGSTYWLQTQSPAQPGSVMKLRFAVWDAGDHVLDSTTLIDNFVWSADPATGSTTTPVPTPK